jgi:tetratricopeptide (TPR) repeat protein
MQKIILIIILIISSQLGKSQNISEYYKSINNAELSIIDSNYTQAIIDYNLAFKANDQPIGKDIYNFAICCLFEGNFEKSIVLFQQLVDLDYNIANFSELKNSELGKTLPLDFFRKLGNLKPTSRITLNYSLRDSLVQITNRDQFFRIKEGVSKIYGDTTRVENDSLMKSIIKAFGYPNEYLIGVNQNLNPRQNFDFSIWIQTTFGPNSEWVNLMKQAIWEGNIEPHIGVGLIQNYIGVNSYNANPFIKFVCKKCTPEMQKKIEGKVFYSKINQTEKKIDEFREGVYLEKIGDYVKKYSYDVKKNKNFKFFYGTSGSPTFDFEKEDDFKRYFDSLTLLEFEN